MSPLLVTTPNITVWTGCLEFTNMNMSTDWHLNMVKSIFTYPSIWAGYDIRSIFKWSLTGLNSEFSFSKTSCLTKAEEPSLPYYSLIAGGRIIGFIPFPRVLVLCEMQSASSRIWTRVTVSITPRAPWWNLLLLLTCMPCMSFLNIWWKELQPGAAFFTVPNWL